MLRAIDAAIADGRLHAHGIARPVPRPEGAGPEEPSAPIDPELFAALREWRTGRARADGVPAVRGLRRLDAAAIAAALPASADELLAIGGVGQVKVERYGPDCCAWWPYAAANDEGAAGRRASVRRRQREAWPRA